MWLATELLERKKKKMLSPSFIDIPLLFTFCPSGCIHLGAAENVPVLVLLASPITLPFK